MKTWHEFFQDTNGDYSMARLLLFGTWFFSSVIMTALVYTGHMSEGYLTMYLAFPAGTYAWSKAKDVTAPPPSV